MEKAAGESKAARHERIKGAGNPWELLEVILSGADRGAGAMSREELDVRTRWWGLYPQGDGQGVRGATTDRFMVRVRIPGGRLTVRQLRALGRISEEHARGTADITVRQNLQFHHVEAASLRPLFRTLASVGLSTQGACGDDTRNITACPVADLLSAERAIDRKLLSEVDRALNGNPLFYNLPRKFKITFAGDSCGCTYPEINDAGILPVVCPELGEGYAFRVGGGLSTRPHLSLLLPRFIAPDKVVPVLLAIATLFRGREELREKRERARLKFLFLDHGWTIETFAERLEEILGERLPSLGTTRLPKMPVREERDHLGIHPQQDGRFYAGLAVAGGALSPGAIEQIALLAERFGSGEVRLTSQQNVILPGISLSEIPPFEAALSGSGIAGGGAFASRVVSCTGKSFCRLALAETKELGERLAERLEEAFPGSPSPPYIHLSGCPNDCGQMRIADIGLSGVQGKNGDNGTEDGFDLFVGGGQEGEISVSRRTGVRLLKDQVAPFVTRILAFYRANCQNDETFRAFLDRTGTDWIGLLDKGTPDEIRLFTEGLSLRP
ncbi:MAG: nitrite/sulfite reductase [Leptospirillia bacterium]